mmetsp:Transcript_24326/g.51329  ORF Transcript_24326/g.51329 Transcript_24326/m.51329 type:complete len:488 (+) Transcript_24326:113-1576(+)
MPSLPSIALAAIAMAASSMTCFAFTRPSGKLLLHRREVSSVGKRNSSIHATFEDDNHLFHPLEEMTRPIITAVTSAFVASSILFSSVLLPPLEAQAAPSAPPPSSSTATSIDIDLKGVPALTRKAIVNRDALSKYLVESAKSIEPILRLLSESDTVTIRPPQDVKGAIKSLAGGEAQFVVNGDNLVDIRVESVPGVVVVRIINPNIPRLPFLKDGTEAMRFVDKIVDEAPAEMEKVANEFDAVERFLTWGAPQKAPIQYKGSTLDYFLGSKFLYQGKPISLGIFGDLNNSEVIVAALAVGVAGVYSSSYAYYIKLNEDAEREAAEKKEKAAAAKKAQAAAAKKEKEVKEKPGNEKIDTKEEVEPSEEKATPVQNEEDVNKEQKTSGDSVEGNAAAAKKEKEVEEKSVKEKIDSKEKMEPVEEKSTLLQNKEDANEEKQTSDETVESNATVERRYDIVSEVQDTSELEVRKQKQKKRDVLKKLFRRGE